MEIEVVDFTRYQEIFCDPYHRFNSSGFNALNVSRADEVFCMVFHEKKPRLGIIGGVREQVFHSPFSAPFGGFTFLSEDCKIEYLDHALNALEDWSVQKKLKQIQITLPPDFYNSSFIAKQLNALYRSGFLLKKTDLNYQFNCSGMTENYDQQIWYNARKNLKRCLKENLVFQICKTAEEKKQAYDTIATNRSQRGFPLRMSWEQVASTIEVLEADFFLVKNDENKNLASAIVFHVARDIVEVIYWGDLPEFAALKTMNFLSYHIFNHYKEAGIRWIDIGPSTENSIPNFGLCEFKESIGCTISPKFSFHKILN